MKNSPSAIVPSDSEARPKLTGGGESSFEGIIRYRLPLISDSPVVQNDTRRIPSMARRTGTSPRLA